MRSLGRYTTPSIIIYNGIIALFISLGVYRLALAEPLGRLGEKTITQYIASEAFTNFSADRRCHDQSTYRVYLIDNFEQRIELVPEVLTSHGEMLVRLLQADREDIEIRVLNTSLSRGLAEVIHDLRQGTCVDAVVSSIPGSNYTYNQISSLFGYRVNIAPENILYHRSALGTLLHNIAVSGFPSVEWLQTVDVNAAKLRHDARKFVFIEALGRFGVPVILPYGNRDVRHNGQIKMVNLLSLAANALAYSALDQKGERVDGYPYSPLSAGDETAIYNIVECPHPSNPFKAVLDINADGYQDYAFFRAGEIAYRNAGGELAFAPPVTRQEVFVQWLNLLDEQPPCRIDTQIVLTAEQYHTLRELCPEVFPNDASHPYVWLNAPEKGRVLEFAPACWARGTIGGTSVIPPNKLRELLPPKNNQVSHAAGEDRQPGIGG